MKTVLRRALVAAVASGTAITGLMIGTAGSASAFDSSSTRLYKGDTMWGYANQWLYGYSSSSNYRLVMQSDGNLVEYKTDLVGANQTVCWSTGTWWAGASHASYQNDGNFVVYRDSDGAVLWASNTQWRSGSFVNINSSGVIWVGNTAISGSC
ncbi:MAG: hypothetical protein HOW97_08205 [Catenulispora sp.]|nr:hypothetical protein [Catenulispora sp.]